MSERSHFLYTDSPIAVARDERLTAGEPFRLAMEIAPTGMMMVDERGRIVLVNSQLEMLFGYGRKELVGQAVEVLVPGRIRSRHSAFRAAFFHDPASRPMGAGRDLYGLRKDGREIPIEVGLKPFRTAEGCFVLGSVVDISERRHVEREREHLLGLLRRLNTELEQRVEARTSELRAALEEREVLLQEVHHRVKNNLQVISSLIHMRARALPKDVVREALEGCLAQVQAMALVHEMLYQSADYAHVPFSEYARSLAANVFEATGPPPGNVALSLAVEDVALAVDKAIPCGLILSELITNALKHAFPDGRPGTVRVELTQGEKGGLRLVVADDGVGLPAGADAQDSISLGLPLVRMLARQLDASLEIVTSHGTTVRLTLGGEP
jgi:PAS domain S-box-containing protein